MADLHLLVVSRAAQPAHCLKHYSLHSRLVNHLRYFRNCRELLREQGMTHPLQPSVGSAVESKQHVVRRDIPVLQTYGPQQVHDLDGGQFGFAETVADYVEKLKDEPNTLDEGVQAIWHIFQQSTVRARDLRLLLNRIVVEIMGTMDEEDPAEAPLMHYLDNLLDAVAAVWSGKWLLGHLHGFVETQEIGRGTLDAAQEEIANLEQLPAFPDRLPRPLTSKQLVFLHLFSGFRRCGDVQEAVETIAAAHQLDVKALSVDVVISLKHGDLLRTDTKNCFLEAVRAKWVTGLIAGPPCETWSVARESVLEGAPGPKTGAHGRVSARHGSFEPARTETSSCWQSPLRSCCLVYGGVLDC